ncbi:MAG: hypothetical protein JW724_04300 [Candidatus Altiarchaeota archaeon]|nr:hypothetical protein [Candidatus Altiarchaeota archaeon]
MYAFLLIFIASFAATFLLIPWIIPKLKKAGLTGKDVNKPDKPEVAEMGGFAVIFGLSAGVLLAIALSTFLGYFNGGFQLSLILAAFSTILLMTLVGVFDDLFSMHQAVKATLPLFAALPLVAVNAGVQTMTLPFIGVVPFGIVYTLILIPIGVAGASNVTNMLAGFNGLEAGMGSIACLSLAFIALSLGEIEAAILLAAILGALLAFLYFNWHPSKILIGDIGTLSIGAVIASSVIIGNFEMAGIIVIIPYALDFFIKAVNGFPSRNWWGDYVNGKLFCRGKPVGLCQMIMKASGGIAERNLVLFLIGLESLFGILAVLYYLFR